MITGVVTADREATVRLTVCNAGGGELAMDAVIDTGFDGCLTLPRSMISQLGLSWRRRGRVLLADGGESVFDIYEGVVVWDGQPRRIAVDEADTAPLIGMSLLEGYELTVQICSGGTVIVALLPY